MFFLLDLGIGGEGGLNLNPSSPDGLLNPGVGVGVGLVGVGEPKHMMNNNLGFQTHILPDMIDCQGYNILIYPFYYDIHLILLLLPGYSSYLPLSSGYSSYFTPVIRIFILFTPFIRIFILFYSFYQDIHLILLLLSGYSSYFTLLSGYSSYFTPFIRI